MSDRFYAQQCTFFNVKPAELIYAERYRDTEESKKLYRKLAGKNMFASGRRTKAVATAELGEFLGADIKGLDKLTLVEIDSLMNSSEIFNEHVLQMPSGRTKKPYVDAITQCATDADVDWTRCTVATLKELLNHIGVN